MINLQKCFRQSMVLLLLASKVSAQQDDPRQPQTIALLKEMLGSATAERQSPEHLLFYLKKISPSFRYTTTVYSDTAAAHKNGLDSTISFALSGQDAETVIVVHYLFRNPLEPEIHKEIFWYPSCGYGIKAGRTLFENGSPFAITFEDIRSMLGSYKTDPNNKLRKESNRYTFYRKCPATGRKIRVEVTTVFPSTSRTNFISAISLFFE